MTLSISSSTSRSSGTRASPSASLMASLQKQQTSLQKELASAQQSGDPRTAAAVSDSINERITAVKAQISALQDKAGGSGSGASASSANAGAVQAARQSGSTLGTHVNIHV